MKPIYLFMDEGSEEVESLGVIDIVRRAEIPIQIVSVTGSKMVTGSHGIKIETDLLLEEADLDNAAMLVLPGGLPGTYNLNENVAVRAAVLRHYEEGKLLAAICAAPIIFGQMGLLQGRRATCYPGFDDQLEGATYTAALVERDGQIITGKGPAAVFEFGYTIVEAMGAKEKADALRAGMLYAELQK